MNWEFAWEVACKIGTAVYSAGLLALGAQMLRAQPGVRRYMNAHATALSAHAAALTRSAASEDTIARIAADVAEIKATRIADPSLLDRVYRVLEQRETERRSQAEAS